MTSPVLGFGSRSIPPAIRSRSTLRRAWRAARRDGVVPMLRRQVGAHLAHRPSEPPPEPLDTTRTLLFLHIPKTAGTSLRHLLEGVVPAEQRAWVYRDPPGMPPEAFMALPLEQRARVRLVYGHFRLGLDEHIPGPSTYLTMLRDPVERATSLYHHFVTIPDSRWHDRIVARSLSLEDFACTGAGGLTDNGMLRHLLPGQMPSFGQWPDDALEAAIQSIEERFEAVLVMERMDASLAELGRILGRALGEIPRLNVSRGRPARERLDPRVVRRIQDVNRLDVGLYDWALERLDRRNAADLDRRR